MTTNKRIVGAILLLLVVSARPASAVLLVEATFGAQGSFERAAGSDDLGAGRPNSHPFGSSCPLRRAYSQHSQWSEGADFGTFSGSGLASGSTGSLPCLGLASWVGLERDAAPTALRSDFTAWIPGFSVSRIFRPPKCGESPRLDGGKVIRVRKS